MAIPVTKRFKSKKIFIRIPSILNVLTLTSLTLIYNIIFKNGNNLFLTLQTFKGKFSKIIYVRFFNKPKK